MMRFRGLNVRMCSGCLEKMREIDRLKHKLDRKSRRIASLEKKLGERRRSPDELPFGASTPSSKLPFKDNSPDEKRRLKGGAKPGHVGHGRKVPEAFEPPERIGAGCFCPGCGGNAKVRKTERRHVRDYIPERVVDRYRAYNRLPFELQYCYAHLKRDVEKLEKEFPKSVEVRKFCRALGRQLAAAMGLRNKKLSDHKYYVKAQRIASKIVGICDSQARHPGIQDIQNIFRQNPHRLYHWARDRRVPADNNYSERGLRPLVISRKLSFGTQSAVGSRTRTVLMSVLHSLEKRGFDPVSRLREAISLKATAPDTDLVDFLFPPFADALREISPLT